MATKLFDGFDDISEGEQEFIHNVLADNKTFDGHRAYTGQAQVLATLRLAKEIERASKSSDKQSKAMFWLTVALAFFAAVQAVGMVVPFFTGK